jgi:hypothetical protein
MQRQAGGQCKLLQFKIFTEMRVDILLHPTPPIKLPQLAKRADGASSTRTRAYAAELVKLAPGGYTPDGSPQALVSRAARGIACSACLSRRGTARYGRPCPSLMNRSDCGLGPVPRFG